MSDPSRDLTVDPEPLEMVARSLDRRRTELSSSDFLVRFRVGAGSFGGSPAGSALAVHHAAAHRIMAETLEGVLVDLDRFARGIESAVEYVRSADDTNAEAIAAKQQAVAAISAPTAYSEGERRNEQSRGRLLGEEG